jgi:HEPN domain-containing protein
MSEPDLVSQWFKKAKSDLRTAKYVFDDLYPKEIEISCFHCQQAAEKSLKGYLASQGVIPPKTHNLDMLHQMCAEHDASFEILVDACRELSLYAVTTRYPDDDEILEDDAIIALNEAEKIYTFCAAQTSAFMPEISELIQGET